MLAVSMINKRNALLLFTGANAAYLAYFFVLMIWLKEPLFMSVFKSPVQVSSAALITIQAATSILSLIVFVGLAQVLHYNHESRLLGFGLYASIIMQLYFNVLAVLKLYHVAVANQFITYPFYIGYAILIYVAAALNFVQNQLLKNYYRWFGIATLLVMILVRAMPIWYEQYGFRWLLINPGVLKTLPFFISLFLFIRYYRAISKAV